MEISEVRRVKSRYVVVLNGERYTLTKTQYQERPYQPGDEADPEELEQWLLKQQFRPAMDYAVSQLAMRPHAEGELRQKLCRLGYCTATADLVLYKLRKLRLLDDADFARQWAASRAVRQLGSRRIAQELRQKGVSAEETEAALEAIPPETAHEAAVALAEKALRRAKPGEDPRKTAQRALAALARRGYAYPEAKAALEEALAGES